MSLLGRTKGKLGGWGERFDTLLIRGHDIKAIEGADKPYLPKIRPYLPKITLIFYS